MDKLFTLDELKQQLIAEFDETRFINFFELTIEDLADRFTDLIDQYQTSLALELGLLEDAPEYEDRTDYNND